MIQPRDSRSTENRNTRADGLRGVVEQCGEVRVTRKAETSDTCLRTVHDHERAIRKCDHARHDTFRGLDSDESS